MLKKTNKVSENISAIIISTLFLVMFSTIARSAIPIPTAPAVAAKNYFVMDFASGKVLAEKNPDVAIEPASITKMMTAFIIYQALASGKISLEDKVIISEKAWRMGGSRMYLDVNSHVPIKAVLKGLIIQSGNDASVALAEHVAGSETAFVEMMNQQAKKLGMSKTHFVNSTGWPDELHLTTARDIAKLASALIRQFPEHYRLYAEKEYSYNKIKQYNRNALLWRDSSVDGIKTGHTESAGYCLVTSAKRANMRVISVVLGTKSKEARASISQTLLDYSFRFFESHLLYQTAQELATPRIWGGMVENLSAGVAQDFFITIARGSYDKLDASVQVNKNMTAPVKQGQVIGDVTIRLEGVVIATTPLVVLQAVEEGGFFLKIKDYLLRQVAEF